MAKMAKATKVDERLAVFRQRQNLKMAGSVHAYVRGNTRKFYEWLDIADHSKIPQGCGCPELAMVEYRRARR
jgi:hypothetical protein